MRSFVFVVALASVGLGCVFSAFIIAWKSWRRWTYVPLALASLLSGFTLLLTASAPASGIALGVAVLCLLTGFFAAFCIAYLSWQCKRESFAFSKVDYILVLGCGLVGKEPGISLRKRLDAALAFARTCPSATIVVCGGRGPDESCAEAEAMSVYLVERGVDRSRILAEDKSTTTRESFRNFLALQDKEGFAVGVATTSFHMKRALTIGRQEGIERCFGIPAWNIDMPWQLPYQAVREAVALFAMRAMPQAGSIRIGRCRF